MQIETHIGQYKILRTLGSGGMGTVFLGEHLLLGRRAAIKTLLPALSSQREIVDRFFNEARAISSISDPGVVQVFDFGFRVDGTAYIVMEFLEGESLAARLDRYNRLPLAVALRIARQIAQSLGAAHVLGIVHRDLKPANVFLIHDPEAQGGERTKILDFGICKLSEPDGMVTQTGTMIGTPVYMSPEQCRGTGRIDHRSDIYSVGCALYHMLTGQPPFRCDSIGDFIAAHLKDAPQPPSTLVPGVPAAVDTLVVRCLAKSPADRFQSMAELHAAIERVLAAVSDAGSAIGGPLVAATPLGDGFRSAYDVNVDSSPTMGDWFVDSQAEVSAASITGDWIAARRRDWTKRLALVVALLGGIVAGVFGTGYAMHQYDDMQKRAIPAQPAVGVTEEPALVVRTTTIAPIVKRPRPPRPYVTKATRPPRPYVKHAPRPRRMVPDEDLYDTR